MSRTYKSPLREEQMEQTRERILDTLTDMFADETPDEITVALVAERAKVSVRTAYRYFPTREALMDAFNAHIGKRTGTTVTDFTVEELPAVATKLFTSFGENERLFRATRRSPASHDLRKRRKLEQVRSLQRAIAKAAPNLDPSRAKIIGAALHNTFGSEAWLAMIDNWGLTSSEAVESVRWALDAMLTKLETEKPRKGRK